jgi:phospholipid/cholesterol/gamma-HCH transport system ATP-binding protein
MTLRENVAFPLRRHTKLSESDIKDRAMEKLAQVELTDFAESLPAEISGGMRKRAGLARAMALDPKIMLYDEPTAGLDPITAREIDNLIIMLKKRSGVTSITVTHEIVCARNIGDKFAMLNKGRVVHQGSFEELQASKDPFVRQFLADAYANFNNKNRL